MEIIKKSEWNTCRREPLQSYNDYEGVVRKAIRLNPLFSKVISDDSGKNLFRRAEAARMRAEQSLEIIIYSYSAGTHISILARRFPECVSFFKKFSECDLEFESSNQNDGHKVPHLDLCDTYYWKALQLICFAILLGHPTELSSIMELLVHENDNQDALLEALVAPYLPGRPGSTIYTRHLPYRKTRHIFQAEPEKRPALMAQYLKEWYLASRREPYHDRHKSSLFPGYWSLEAGAITFILDIDDSTYRDMPFYPKDLVDYARSVSSPPGQPKPINPRQPRMAAGETCPKTGWWFSPAKDNSLRYFKEGAIFPTLVSDYGLTFWLWSSE